MDTSFQIILLASIPLLFGYTQAQLLAQDVSEGPCLSKAELLPFLYTELNLFLIQPAIGTIDYYIPMASEALYREYAEAFLGRPADTQQELDRMQVVLRCEPAFTLVQNMGFPDIAQPPSFGQTCTKAGHPSLGDLGLTSGQVDLDYAQAVCVGLTATRPNGSLAWLPSQSFAETVDSLIWANEGRTAFLMYRCPANGIKDFKVLSITKTLAPQDIEIIKQKIVPLGFAQDLIAYMSYDQ